MARQLASNQRSLEKLRPHRGNPAWIKGVSGNPTGRPKTEYDVAAMARAHSPAAIAALAKALDDPKLSVHAAVALLDRGFGRPRQVIEAPDGSTPSALHLLAAQLVSAEIVSRLGGTIDGRAERGNETAERATARDLLNAPPPSE